MCDFRPAGLNRQMAGAMQHDCTPAGSHLCENLQVSNAPEADPDDEEQYEDALDELEGAVRTVTACLSSNGQLKAAARLSVKWKTQHGS